MADGMLSIGQASKRTGLPVKTLRFYSDRGLVPPSGRSHGGYRLYSETDLAKLDLIRTLRDAGLGLEAIGSVLRHERSLADVMRVRLGAIEAHVRSLRNVAAALRAALREGEPSEPQLRRLYAVTQLTNEERKATIVSFYEKVSDGIPMDEGWKERMIEGLAPSLPDEPTPAQLDAWIELAEILADPAFIATVRETSQQAWQPGFDSVRAHRVTTEAASAATAALARQLEPTSSEAAAIVERLVQGTAEAYGKPVDPAFRHELAERYRRQDPRATRVWELAAILNGTPGRENQVAEWTWLRAAAIHHMQSAG